MRVVKTKQILFPAHDTWHKWDITNSLFIIIVQTQPEMLFTPLCCHSNMLSSLITRVWCRTTTKKFDSTIYSISTRILVHMQRYFSLCKKSNILSQPKYPLINLDLCGINTFALLQQQTTAKLVLVSFTLPKLVMFGDETFVTWACDECHLIILLIINV